MRLANAPLAWWPRRVYAIAGLFALLWLTGCAGTGPLPSPYPDTIPPRVELEGTPFFADDSHYCGPAALATSLSAAGFPTKPQSLIGQVFLPGREGSLQIEMLSGARRQGAVATMIPGSTQALWREVAAGHPVVVLQNLGLSWAPSWHYAVVVGYDSGSNTVLLRSGPMKRQEMGLRTFMHTWDRSERWAFVTLPPDQLPATATEAQTVSALVAFERNASASASVVAYRTGLSRWPANPTLAMGLGNALYASGDKTNAEVVFRQVIEAHHLAAAYNNLARLLLERGEASQARVLAEQGLSVAGPLREMLMETLQAAQARSTAPQWLEAK